MEPIEPNNYVIQSASYFFLFLSWYRFDDVILPSLKLTFLNFDRFMKLLLDLALLGLKIETKTISLHVFASAHLTSCRLAWAVL